MIDRRQTECRCGHTRECHYTKEGTCVYQSCECQEFHPKGRPEFNSKRSRCEYGHAHDSGLEIRTCGELHLRKLARDIKDFNAQVRLELKGPSGKTIAHYKVDFVVEHNDGTIEYLECKGSHLTQTGQWPLKWALLEDMYEGNPKVKLRVIQG